MNVLDFELVRTVRMCSILFNNFTFCFQNDSLMEFLANTFLERGVV